MSSRVRLLVCLALVGLLYVFHVHLKTAKIFSNPTWNAQDETGQFWSEAAFQYRFAKFFSEHPIGDWGQLAHDRDVQHPDVIDDWAEFTVAMEVPAGVLYRWFSPAVPFHVFVVWYDCLVSSLSLFAVFLLARALWRSDGAGLFAAVLYASLYPSYGRTVKNLFLREDFAIPLILFALAFTVRALQEVKRRDQFLAAMFWLAALASWHLTQFVMAPLVLAAVLVYLGRGETPRRPWLVIVLTLGAFLIPVLRAKQFYLSPTMGALYALNIAVWINGGRRRAFRIFCGSLALFLVLGMLARKSYGEYAHVYALFFAKLRCLGMKPADPSKLPWEARVLWEGAFNTSDWMEWWHSLGFCLPLSLLAIFLPAREKNIAVKIFTLFTLILFPLAWMVVRYFTFLGFGAAVMSAGLLTKRSWWKAVVPVATVTQLVMLNFKPFERTQPNPAEYTPIVQWVNEHTETNAVVLATITESPVLWAHTGRPMILHPKFENHEIRERYRDFLESIYASEDRFHEFARRYEADYFVYDAGFMIDEQESRRYKADKLGPLPADCAAVLFQEHPDHLQHFKLELAAGRFALFRVLR
jgi:hypothetical protein